MSKPATLAEPLVGCNKVVSIAFTRAIRAVQAEYNFSFHRKIQMIKCGHRSEFFGQLKRLNGGS